MGFVVLDLTNRRCCAIVIDSGVVIAPFVVSEDLDFGSM